jgi:hypothetical protein
MKYSIDPFGDTLEAGWCAKISLANFSAGALQKCRLGWGSR